MEACSPSFDSTEISSISNYVNEENYRKSEINGCAGDNVKVLLEVEVSQCLYENRHRKSKDNRLDPDDLVEVTIIHPAACESKSTLGKSSSKSPKILNLIKENDKVHGDHPLGQKYKENISEIKNNMTMSKSKVPLKIPQSGDHYRSDNSDNVGSDQDDTLTDSLESQSKTVIKEEPAAANVISEKKIDVSQISKKATSDPGKIPFIELGAVHKVLDRLKTEMKRPKSQRDNFSKELIPMLQKLLGGWDERKLDEFLKKDQSLTKCEYCGVISCLKSSRGLTRDTESNRLSPDHQRSSRSISDKNYLKIYERSITTRKDNSDKKDIHPSAQTRSRFSPELSEISGPRNAAGYSERYLRANDPIQNKTMAAERDSTSNEVSGKTGRSFQNPRPARRPIREASAKRPPLFTSVRRACERNAENHVDDSETKSKIKTGTKKPEVEADVIADKQRRVRQRNETQEKAKGRTFNNPRVAGDAVTRRRCRSSDLPKAEEHKNERVKEVDATSREPVTESQTPEIFENLTAGSVEVQSVFPIELTPLKDTMKYLAKGQLSIADKKEDKNKVFKDLAESTVNRIFDKRKQSFVLHASRDGASPLDAGFWLCDSGRAKDICEKLEKCNEPALSVAKDTCENERSFKSDDAISLGNRTEEKSENFPESDTTAFSSSSAENLIREWMKPDGKILQTLGGKKREVGDKELVSGSMEKLLSSDKRAEIIRIVREKISKAIENRATYSVISEDKLYNDENSEAGKIQGKLSKRSVGQDLIKTIDTPIKLKSTKRKSEVNSKKACCCGPSLKPFDISREIIEKIWGTKESSLKLTDDPIDEGRCLAKQQYIIISAPTTKIEESPKGSLKMTYKNPVSRLSLSSTENRLKIENSERFEREVIYDDSSRDTVSTDTIVDPASRGLPMYRKILDSNEEMDWESFEQLVGTLNPEQRDLWSDICKAVSNEAKRVAGETGATTEVCIEIDPVPCKERKGKVRVRADEVTFEMDMTLKDVESFLDKKLARNYENSKDQV
ncbi:uncharacterized protein LOC112494078 [Cephus cinctus]|uniref:Uncharacterized protein LOC112494078 n=1 Tax=Cephus cinctus TaxID=211228 RepID=A0AAJ7VZH3_CEPCN|nr:uncharacterized protein LOC112494078 [Cephus cinctus]